MAILKVASIVYVKRKIVVHILAKTPIYRVDSGLLGENLHPYFGGFFWPEISSFVSIVQSCSIVFYQEYMP